MPKTLLIIIPLMLLAAGCATSSDGTWKAPLVYRVDIQQGNVVDQVMIDKLKPGMDKKQVKYIMGTPLITDTFHGNRWDYVYSYEPARGNREQRRVTLFFENEKLARIDGDIKISDKPRVDDDSAKERSVAVPLEEDKPGIFKRMFSRNKDKDEAEKEAGDIPVKETPAVKTTLDAETGAVTTDTLTQGIKTELSSEEPTDAEAVTAKIQGTETITDETDNAPENVAVTQTKEDDKEKSTAGDTQEKNLLRRFWDRMTKDGDEGDTEVETEQDRRDAEVLEKAGGDL